MEEKMLSEWEIEEPSEAEREAEYQYALVNLRQRVECDGAILAALVENILAGPSRKASS